MRNILCLLLLLPLSAAHTPKPNTFADPLDSAMMEIVGGTYKWASRRRGRSRTRTRSGNFDILFIAV